jgi:UDP-N-acetylmuramoyl-L-alanyl-D-glutamate--2,6-diaminopimelate ligase
MGRAAAEASDLTIITSDNPRSEEPDAIIDAVMSGVGPVARVLRVRDRREAIAQAIESASAGDVVVLAGKGHESTQTVGDLVIPLDDRLIAKELLR